VRDRAASLGRRPLSQLSEYFVGTVSSGTVDADDCCRAALLSRLRWRRMCVADGLAADCAQAAQSIPRLPCEECRNLRAEAMHRARYFENSC